MPTDTDNRVLTWGVNDNCALGRDTTWEGRAIDALNPYESAPSEVDWSRSQLPPGVQFCSDDEAYTGSMVAYTTGVTG